VFSKIKEQPEKNELKVIAGSICPSSHPTITTSIDYLFNNILVAKGHHNGCKI